MISSWDLDDADALSGMPYRMARALRGQGYCVTHISDRYIGDMPISLFFRVRRRVRSIRQRRTPLPVRRFTDTRFPRSTRNILLRQITQRSLRAQTNLERLGQQGEHFDAIFGCCISSVLYALHTNLPVIYFSDATLMVIKDTYPRLSARGTPFHAALHEIESQAVSKATRAVFASPYTRNSAINDLGIDPDRASVVPMGAHILPQCPERITAPTPPPTREDCMLLIVAADPIRKRVDLALDATLLLRKRGINATLHIVGPGTKRSNASPVATSHGRLKLSDPHDQGIHRRLLRDAHLQLLPSTGEAFGIAPAESAHFARPSIVSDAGGLPFVVLHDQTGIVIDRHLNPTAWADAIESLIENPDTYRRLSTAALARARAELNWDAWGRSMHRIIDETITEHHRVPPVC